MKVTCTAQVPLGIIGDIDILKEAPLEMIQAGIGDILGKYTCLVDWKLAHIINDEYYCEHIVEMVESAITKCVKGAEAGDLRATQVITDIMEALVLSGIAISFAGNSRPASGAEHHLSHFWEMQYLFEGKEPILHGIKVGLGTIAILKSYETLKALALEDTALAQMRVSFNKSRWEQDIHRLFKQAAAGILALEEKVQKNDLDKLQTRFKTIQEKWLQIVNLTYQLPEVAKMEALFTKIGLPINPAEIGLSAKQLVESIIYAKEVRDRYTILQLLWDIGQLAGMADCLTTYFDKGQTTYLEKVLKEKKEKLKQIKCFILDMDGTIYLSNRLFPFTKPFLEKLQSYGKDYVFFTNNSSRNATFYQEKLARMGITIAREKLFISNQVIAKYLLDRKSVV